MDWIGIALAVATAILGALTTILVKGFSAGKYLQRTEDRWAEVNTQVVECLNDIAELRRAIRDEDQARRLTVDKVTADFGRLELRVSVLERQSIMATEFEDRETAARERRLDHLEQAVRDLLRGPNRGSR